MAFISAPFLPPNPFLRTRSLPSTRLHPPPIPSPTAPKRRRPHLRPPTASLPLSHTDRLQAVLDVLSQVIDPDLHQNIVSLGFIKNVTITPVPAIAQMYDVAFDVQLTTPACPVKETFRTDCRKLVENLTWVASARVNMTAASPTQQLPSDQPRPNTAPAVMDNVNAIIAVASCKGGVGKSTTAVNLAFTLAHQGARVGIMDADIYGPSLPTLVEPDDRAVKFVDGKIQPLTRAGVKLMSFGYVNPDSAIMRGPMIANVLNQLITTTQWGALDYLVIDMPPGTGDIQLTLSQIVNITAAVIVTTPQKLSFVDVVKGIDMFDKVNVPSVAVVENMAYFVAPESQKRHYVFGRGHKHRLVEQYGLVNSFSMPIDAQLSEQSDKGVPYVIAQRDSLVTEEYEKLSATMVREVAKIKFGSSQIPEVSFDEQSSYIVITRKGEEEQRVWPASLRRQCRCALCVDEMTGRVRLKAGDVKENVKPKVMSRVGNYALSIDWSDGHGSLYPFSRFVDNWENRNTGIRERSDSASVQEDMKVGMKK